jgi:hypothetical protein
MTDALACPECSQSMKSGGFVLSQREDDGQRTCRTLWRCTDRYVWWCWTDRPAGRTFGVLPAPGTAPLTSTTPDSSDIRQPPFTCADGRRRPCSRRCSSALSRT